MLTKLNEYELYKVTVSEFQFLLLMEPLGIRTLFKNTFYDDFYRKDGIIP